MSKPIDNKRKIKIITNDYGIDMLQEAIEEKTLHIKRIYFGYKIPGFLKYAKNLKFGKSIYTGRAYRKIGIKPKNFKSHYLWS